MNNNKHMNTKNKIITGGVLLIILSFYGGMKYEQKKLITATTAARTSRTFPGGAGGGRTLRGGASTIGSILSLDSKSLTIKLQDGGSRIVFFSSSTPITKNTTGSLSDLQVGTNVLIQDTQNTDGSVTANGIQLRPAFPQQ